MWDEQCLSRKSGAQSCQYRTECNHHPHVVPFKGFHWIRCAEDLTSRFEARLASCQPRSKLNIRKNIAAARPESGTQNRERNQKIIFSLHRVQLSTFLKIYGVIQILAK